MPTTSIVESGQGADLDATSSRISTRAESFYLPQLDGLRFVAAALVFFSHTAPVRVPVFREIQQIGWCGVDLFLVLSAFLLTQLITLEFAKTRGFNIKYFYIRRLLRIWPLHLGFVTAMLVVQCFLYPNEIRSGIGFWFSHVFFVNNVVLATLGFEHRLAFTSQLWTVSLEEQFYLIVPLIMATAVLGRAVNRIALGKALGATLLAIIGIRAACALLQMPYPFVAALPFRGDAIVLGLFLGIGIRDFPAMSARGVPKFVLGIALLAVVAIMPSIENPGWQQVPGYTIVALGCSLVMLGILERNVISRVLAAQPFRYLGKISFGLYVYHALCLGISKKATAYFQLESWWVGTLLAAVLTVILGCLSYELYEKRFLLMKKRFSAVSSRPA